MTTPRRARISGILAAAVAALLMAGCGDAGDGSCPAVGGAWLVVDHCEESYLGTTVDVNQDACTAVVVFEGAAFAGRLDGEAIDVSGQVDGTRIECSGLADEDEIDMSCDVDGTSDVCHVRLRKR